MPDLHTVAVWTCCSNEHWETEVEGSKGDTYVVSFGKLDLEEQHRQYCEYGWTCTCKGFQYRGKCKHLTQIQASGRFCGWNDGLEPSAQPDQGEDGGPICPDCGGPVMAVNVGV